METPNIAHTSKIGERVASIYADAYFYDDHCDYQKPDDERSEESRKRPEKLSDDEDWTSPSDLLIGIIELIPPFTSKITRGITHQGIIGIGNAVMDKEKERFQRYINKLLNEHEVVWNQILAHQKIIVEQKVQEIYRKILATKSKTMMKEINKFYETTLQELEDHMRSEVSNVLKSTHASIVSDLNNEIKLKLEKEKEILEKVLQKRYASEVKKIKHYYRLLLDNEDNRFKQYINQALHARNDALKAFYRQIETETTTSTMYVMCAERKRCRIRKFLLDNYHSARVADKLKLIKEQEKILEGYIARDKQITELNREWEDKMKKILKLFLKFISFSLKLLPEQAMFLLDLEKMVVLQLNEMQRTPSKTSILIDEEDIQNFEFAKLEEPEPVCDKEPFVIVGDTDESIPTPHGSRESLASNVSLPVIRLQRKFLYARCDKHAEIKAFIESKRCKCTDQQKPATPPPKEPTPVEIKSPTPETESSFEHLVMDDIDILPDCPARNCQDWAKKYHFPYMMNYLDYNEENYSRVKAFLGKPEKVGETQAVKARDFVYQELPFAVTQEKTHNVGTQCSSKESLSDINMVCRCTNEAALKLSNESSAENIPFDKEIETMLKQRRNSLIRLIHSNPNLLKIFTDEDFDFIYPIKI